MELSNNIKAQGLATGSERSPSVALKGGRNAGVVRIPSGSSHFTEIRAESHQESPTGLASFHGFSETKSHSPAHLVVSL